MAGVSGGGCRAPWHAPARYHAASTASFEQIGVADLRYNRLVLYPANCLHCGDIGESWSRDTLSEEADDHLPDPPVKPVIPA
jgi:hypothetical protein